MTSADWLYLGTLALFGAGISLTLSSEVTKPARLHCKTLSQSSDSSPTSPASSSGSGSATS